MSETPIEKQVYAAIEEATREVYARHPSVGGLGLMVIFSDAVLPLVRASSKVSAEVLSIMEVYHEQEKRGSIDTPGGLEHMGDVWSLLARWEKVLKGETHG